MKLLRFAALGLPFVVSGMAIAAALNQPAQAPATQGGVAAGAGRVSRPVSSQTPNAPVGWQTVTTSQATARLQPVLLGKTTLPIPGLSAPAAMRFWRASGVITRIVGYPYVEMIAYDFGSRCALATTIDISTSRATAVVNGFITVPQVQKRDGVPSLAVDSVITLSAFLHNRQLQAAPACLEAVEASYGDQFDVTQKSVAKLIAHAGSVLAGGPAGSEDAPLSKAAVQQTIVSRIRAGGVMKNATYLGTVRTSDHTVILLGDPRTPVRWAAQYRNLGPGRWQFEGASDAGMTLIKTERPHA